MGTNYYVEPKPVNLCAHCGRADATEQLHIGKSSGGWCFSLHAVPELGLNSLADWQAYISPDMHIVDEYGRQVPLDVLWEVITGRRGSGYQGFDFQANHAEPGPNGLVRHQIDGVHCLAHGDGTWDMIAGEFS